MIKHDERREKELHQEFEEWLDDCSKLDLVNLIGLPKIEGDWALHRLKEIIKDYGVKR